MQVFPVVQTSDLDRVSQELAVIATHPVDGVFLIDHDAEHDRLLAAIAQTRQEHPGLFLGANFVRTTPSEALHIATSAKVRLDALWTDHAQIGVDGDLRAPVQFLELREELGWSGVHFGGIAFKYQPDVPPEKLKILARLAGGVVDVPTTSGPGTGHAAPLAKVRSISAGLGHHPLAVASGVTADNIGALEPYVSHVLVSTSICDDSGRISSVLLSRLLQAAKT